MLEFLNAKFGTPNGIRLYKLNQLKLFFFLKIFVLMEMTLFTVVILINAANIHNKFELEGAAIHA